MRSVRRRRRLFSTSRFATIGLAPLRWIDLAFPTTVADQVDLNSFLRGTDARGIALAFPAPGTQFSTRAYIAARVFDQDLAYVAEESAKHRRKAAVHED